MVYCGLAVVQSFATRLQWGPDEPAHVVYIRSLALDRRLPELTHEAEEDAYIPGAAHTYQAHHPPLYHFLASLAWHAFAGRPDEIVSYRAAGQAHQYTVPGPVRPVRLLSIIFGVGALLLAWMTARTVFPDRPAICLGGVALCAFTPMFTYLTGVINNDSLLVVTVTAVAWRWARVLRFGGTTAEAGLIGLLIGLAINCKETALALLPLTMVVFALDSGARSARGWVGRIMLSLTIAALVGGWWLLRKWLLYGTPFVYAFVNPLLSLHPEQRWVAAYALPAQIFLFAFVPLDVVSRHLPLPVVSRSLGVLAAFSLAGIIALFARRRRLGIQSYEAWSLGLWLLAATFVVGGLLRNVLLIDWRMGSAGGRFLVAVLPLLSLTSARSLSALFGDGRPAKIALVLAVLLMLALNIGVIWATAAEYETLRF